MPDNKFTNNFGKSTSQFHQSSPLVQPSDCRQPAIGVLLYTQKNYEVKYTATILWKICKLFIIIIIFLKGLPQKCSPIKPVFSGASWWYMSMIAMDCPGISYLTTRAVYNHWTGPVDCIGEILHKLVHMHEFL